MSIYYSKYTGEEVENILDSVEKKLDKLTAGDNIKIDGTTISADLSDCLDKDTDTYVESVSTSTSSSSGKAIGLDLSTSTTKVNGDRVTISGIVNLSDFSLTSEVNGLVSLKQDTLTAGTGIDITNNTISCTLETNVFKIVEELPTSDIDTDVIYVVPSGTTGEQNQYTEYIYVNGEWEKLGEFAASVDLSNYYTKDETYSREEIDQMITQATQGGITTVVANGSGELTLEASTSGTTATITGSVDLDDYAKTSDIPTKTSSLTNDSGYITSSDVPTLSDLGGVGSVSASGTSPLSLSASKSGTSVTISGNVDLSDYATVDDVNTKLDKLTAGSNITISGTTISATYSNATTSSAGLMSSSDKSNLDSLNSNAVTSVSASGTSPLTLSSSKSGNSLTISGNVDLSNYATTSSIPTKTSELTNDSGFITSTPTLSDLGGVGSVSASGTSPLTLSASKSGTSVSITGSVDLSSKQDTLTAGDNITISSSNVISADVPVTKWYDLWVSAHDIQYTEGDGYTPSAIEMCVYSYNDTTTSLTIENSVNYQMEICYTNGTVASYYGQTSSTKVSVSLPTSSSPRILYITIIATLQSGMVLIKQIYCHENSIGYSNWNYYLFEGGSSAQTVEIDGNQITIPANTIVEGNFTTDITRLSYQLKRIIIRGDISASISNNSVTSTTFLEEVDLTFSPNYSLSFDYMFYNLRGLKRLRVSGGQATSAQYMCYYVGSSTNEGCEIDIKGMDFSQMTSTNGVRYMCRYAKISSIDLSGHMFNYSAYYMYQNSTINNVNMSGCIFDSDAYYMYQNSTINNVNMSGCQFNSTAYNLFYNSDAYNIDMSGCIFNTSGYGIFYGSTSKNVDMSGCKFNSSVYNLFRSSNILNINMSGCAFNGNNSNNTYYMFYEATINNVDMSGCDLSEIKNVTNFFNSARIKSLNVNGLVLPTDVDLLNSLLNNLNNATSIGGISGSLGLNTINYSTQGGIDLSSIDLDRQSLLTIFSSLTPELSLQAALLGYTIITLSSNSYKTLTTYDIAVVSDKYWTVTY